MIMKLRKPILGLSTINSVQRKSFKRISIWTKWQLNKYQTNTHIRSGFDGRWTWQCPLDIRMMCMCIIFWNYQCYIFIWFYWKSRTVSVCKFDNIAKCGVRSKLERFFYDSPRKPKTRFKLFLECMCLEDHTLVKVRDVQIYWSSPPASHREPAHFSSTRKIHVEWKSCLFLGHFAKK